MTRQRPPAGLGKAGLALWRELTAAPREGGELVFSPAEVVTLRLACRQADDVARLEELLDEEGPVVKGSKGQPKLSTVPAELRLQRAALARLVAALALPQDGQERGLTPTQRRAQKAANARWERQAAKRDERRRGDVA